MIAPEIVQFTHAVMLLILGVGGILTLLRMFRLERRVKALEDANAELDRMP